MNLIFSKNVLLTFLVVAFLKVSAFGQSDNYTPPVLSSDESWTMVMMPDPQSYVKFGRNQGILELMTAWIAEQADALNIEMVMCTGDLVEHNDWLNPNGKQANQSGPEQWKAVSKAFERLDGRVPYISGTGNHDFGVKNIEYRKTHYDKYFPVDKNILSQRMLKDAGFDSEGMPSLTNASYEFKSPHGDDFLFLVLEFAPRDTILKWALDLVNSEAYKDHRVILLTHSYLNAKGEHIVKENYPIEDGNYGRAVFEKLVQPSRNIEMVFSGHIGRPDDFKGHVGFRTDKNAAGKTVNQMVFNAQALGGGWHGNGGDGWLRILEFLPDGETVNVKTFSPLFAISPSTRHMAWQREEYNEFQFKMDKR